MAGVIATIPKFQFSADGQPLVGGTLTAYIAGTTTLTTTWQDSALVTANTNPILLDSRGECVLWLDSTVAYKFVLKNAAGVVQWTQDNISGAASESGGSFVKTSALSARSEANDGAALVGYLPTGAGSVGRSLRQELDTRTGISLARFFNLATRVPGTTDDSPAFNSALAYLSVLGGGLLILPDGDIRLNTKVRNTTDNVQIRGSGHTRILNGTTNTPALEFGDGITRNFRCGIRSVIFGQVAGVTAVDGNCGLNVQKQGSFTEKDITVYEFPGPLHRGILHSDVAQSVFDNVAVQGCLSDGIRFDNICNDIYLTSMRSDANFGNGWVFRDAQGVFGSNCSAFFNHGFGFDIGTAGTFANKNYLISNWVGDTNGNDNWHVTQLVTGKFSQCWGATQKSPSVNVNAVGFFVSGAQTKNLCFEGGDLLFNNSHGMYLGQVDNVEVNGISAGIDGNGNGLSGLASGIYVDSMSRDVRINLGSARANSDYGVRIVSGAFNCHVNGMALSNNTVGPLFNGSTTARVRDCPGYNPRLNVVTTPAFPASTVGVTNTTGVDVTVYLIGGAVSAITIEGSFVMNASNIPIRLAAGATIAVTYSSPPIWQWIGD